MAGSYRRETLHIHAIDNNFVACMRHVGAPHCKIDIEVSNPKVLIHQVHIPGATRRGAAPVRYRVTELASNTQLVSKKLCIMCEVLHDALYFDVPKADERRTTYDFAGG